MIATCPTWLAISPRCVGTTSPFVKEAYARFIFANGRYLFRHARRAATAGSTDGDQPGSACRPSERRFEVADVSRQLLWASVQPAHADHPAEREPAEGSVDLPDTHRTKFPDHADLL